MFCVSIGLVVDGRPTAGAVLDPTRGETFAAAVDGPATLNGRPIRASTKDKLSDYVVSLALAGRSVVEPGPGDPQGRSAISRSMGSASLALAYVGNGRFDAFIQESGLSAWDIAAAGLDRGAGRRDGDGIRRLRLVRPGRKTRTVGVVAAPPAHHPRLLALANGR